MQYKYNNPQSGDQRSISKFLLFPKTLRVGNTNHYETRWFRKCKIIQNAVPNYDMFKSDDRDYKWKDLCWSE